MLYYTQEARESAKVKLQDLREKLSVIPGNVVDYTTIRDTIHYLSVLTDAIEAEERKCGKKGNEK